MNALIRAHYSDGVLDSQVRPHIGFLDSLVQPHYMISQFSTWAASWDPSLPMHLGYALWQSGNPHLIPLFQGLLLGNLSSPGGSSCPVWQQNMIPCFWIKWYVDRGSPNAYWMPQEISQVSNIVQDFSMPLLATSSDLWFPVLDYVVSLQLPHMGYIQGFSISSCSCIMAGNPECLGGMDPEFQMDISSSPFGDSWGI